MTLAHQAYDEEIEPLAAKASEVARILKALSNENRLLILCRLAAMHECSVNALADGVGLSQSALSQHLAKLRDEGLVSFRREGQTLFYSIADPQMAQLLIALKEIYCPGMLPGPTTEKMI